MHFLVGWDTRPALTGENSNNLKKAGSRKKFCSDMVRGLDQGQEERKKDDINLDQADLIVCSSSRSHVEESL